MNKVYVHHSNSVPWTRDNTPCSTRQIRQKRWLCLQRLLLVARRGMACWLGNGYSNWPACKPNLQARVRSSQEVSEEIWQTIVHVLCLVPRILIKANWRWSSSRVAVWWKHQPSEALSKALQAIKQQTKNNTAANPFAEILSNKLICICQLK